MDRQSEANGGPAPAPYGGANKNLADRQSKAMVGPPEPFYLPIILFLFYYFMLL